ncbi:MAG: serine hydrolase [Chitinophagaceae bacterium]|jgi:CubicO group peptidase (beta-lactamase class C family)|nr:serine hydrolase [Chitinophagaceae bacterium]MBK9660239.1 serine hydrolase [Chitinophagaceae bacterium]
MKSKLILFLLLAFNFCFAQKKTVAKADPFAGLDTAFQRVLKDRKAPGFAVAVVSKDKIIYAKGFGYRDNENKFPVTPTTQFAIGSCTKAFTSALMGLLEKDNKLELDKPATSYLPELHFFNDNLNNMVTVRDMMCHRTGLPRHDYSWYLFNTASRDSLLRRIQYQEPTAALRQTWQYNNFMFLAQGMIAEKLTGKSWEENIKERFFAPLGMTTSNLSIHDLKKNKEGALGYTVYKDSLIRKAEYYDINAMGPAGSINSNVIEMANWVMTWINGGKFNGKEILPSRYVKEAMSSQMVMSGALPDKEIPDAHFANYGLGWMLSSYRGHYRVEHGGNIDGFSASTSFFPSDSIGIIVLTNQNASAVTGIVRNIIADRILGIQHIDWNGRRNAADAKAKKEAKEAEKNIVSIRKNSTMPSHQLKDYTGIFNNPGYGNFEIDNRNDSLIMLTRNGDLWLRHYHYDVFEALPIDKEEGIDTTQKENLKIQFQMTTAGDISSVSIPLQDGLKDIEFTKTAKAKHIAKEELAKYVGEFELSAGINAKFYLKGEKTLFAFIEGQPEYELIPTDRNKFDLKILKGYSVLFDENEKGEITAVSFVQPNGTFKAKKIK